jgi:hypothetical protein
VILDGKIILCGRYKEPAISVKDQGIDLWYSGHPRGEHPGRPAPDGFPLWVSAAEPGSVHDITAARTHDLPVLCHAAATGLPTLADPGYDGAGIGVYISVKQPADGRHLDIYTRSRNAIQRSAAAAVAVQTGDGSASEIASMAAAYLGDVASDIAQKHL